MVKPGEEEQEESFEFDAEAAAAELEAQRAGGEANTDPDPDAEEDDDTQEDDKPAADAEEPKAEKPKPGALDEEDVEAFLKANGEKPISVAAFKKRLAKERKKLEEAAAWKPKHDELAAALEAHKKVAPWTPEQQRLYTQYEGAFGKLEAGTKGLPFLAEAIVALGKGQTPDYRKLHQALGEYVEALPTGDPRLFQQQQELRAELDQIKEAEFDRSLQAHIDREEAAVSKLLGADPDPELVQLIDEVHLSMIPEKGDLSKMPDKVKIAKLLLSRDSKLEQRILKKQIPSKPKLRAALPTGGGPAAASQVEETVPEVGTAEWDSWVAGSYKQKG